MKLKRYQERSIERLQKYLRALDAARAKAPQVAALGIDYEWDRQAWKDAGLTTPYAPHKNGLGEPLPFVCLRVPTGGGKTLLAVHAIGDINALYRHAQTGLVLWIVPTSQIYNQTYKSLHDRAHPYRQQLDMASGGRTMILEKNQHFSPEDILENLVVMMLMLPSANRQNKEALKIFQDSPGFEAFFPEEDQYQEHTALRERVTNLDAYDTETVMGGAVKTSLGNTLRLLKPIIVLDEGHKAYSPQAQATLRGFNPCFILELTATPPPQSNRVVDIPGQEVLREGMIKLPVNVHSRASADWHDALIATYRKRESLQKTADDHFEREGVYIRPICLIQVERTGEKQRLPRFVHAEDVRDYLITRLNVLPEEIAVKSSERDEIENIDLLSPDCPIKYIITKQALQEGWDCAFAYILTTLINSKAPVSMTQIVGRILRQPYAAKTGIAELDESYVYYSSPQTGELVNRIYESLHREGLDDAQGGVIQHAGFDEPATEMVTLEIRPQYVTYAGKVYLPCFVVEDRGEFREIGFEMDILSGIRWQDIDLSEFDTLALNPEPTGDTLVAVMPNEMVRTMRVTQAEDLPLSLPFITRQIVDVVPNPWVAYEIVNEVVERLRKRYNDDWIRRDVGLIIRTLKDVLEKGRNNQAHTAFVNLLKTGHFHFWLIAGSAGNSIPERIRTQGGRRLLYPDTGDKPQRSLFDFAQADFNQTETDVALFLDRQEWILGWYRNFVKQGYGIQGWKPYKARPDFTFMQGIERVETVHVLETKGLHLDNPDTDYKRALFELCNEYSKPTPWDQIAQQFAEHRVNFQVVFEDEWQKIINAMIAKES